MADYKRMVSYMYQYENGIKRKNSGYARIEAKNGQCKVTLHVQMLGQPDSIFPTYLIHRDHNGTELIYLGDSRLKNQILDGKLLADENNIMESGYTLSDIGGIILFLNSGEFYATEWDDKPIEAKEIMAAMKPKPKKVPPKEIPVAPEKEVPPVSQNRLTGQPLPTIEEEATIPKYKLPRGWKTVERLPNNPYAPQKKIDLGGANPIPGDRFAENGNPASAGGPGRSGGIERESDLPVRGEKEYDRNRTAGKDPIAESRGLDRKGTAKKEPQEIIDTKGEAKETADTKKELQETMAVQKGTAEAIDTKQETREAMAEKQETAVGQIPSEERTEAARNRAANRPYSSMESPVAARMFQSFPRINPFEDNEVILSVKIEPKDIGLLPRELWGLSNNSFLLHGYYSYRHLIFAKMKDRFGARYIIGVPGTYHNKEKFIARMFGFDCFKPAKKRELRQGDFGYWYIAVSV
ncbi:MAG TPA: hypothetical protein DEP17_09175 [Lachnospiraceae bacterium]|nr:hypothetical protein [Lachnospiraceae bacterium]